MANQYAQTLADTQTKYIDAALGRLTAVREAAEKANRVHVETVQEFLSLAKDDLTALAAGERPSAGEVITRRFTRATQVAALQDKAIRGLVEAWTPVLDQAARDAATGVEDAVKAARDAAATVGDAVKDAASGAEQAVTTAGATEQSAAEKDAPVTSRPAAKSAKPRTRTANSGE